VYSFVKKRVDCAVLRRGDKVVPIADDGELDFDLVPTAVG